MPRRWRVLAYASALYRPRQPQNSPVYRALAQNLNLFYDTYDERFLTQHGPLPYHAQRALEGFLRCGRAQFGFARAHCPACGASFIVPFSCQMRGPCSSCQQKRAEILCRFLTEEVVEAVDHRQLVFVLPKRFRHIFHHDAELLGQLCRVAAKAIQDFYRAGLGRKDVRAGIILAPQLFGDALNPHVHLHVICTDGAFDEQGNFHQLLYDMQKDIDVLKRLFEKKVLDLLVKHKRCSQTHADDILTWSNTGFSVDGSVRVMKGDHGRLQRLARYIARPAISSERVSYDERTGQVVVRSSKKTGGQRPVVAIYDVLTFIALLALQVPPPRIHMVRYFGHYASRCRTMRKQTAASNDTDQPTEPIVVDSPDAKTRRRRWSQLIRQVFEADPLKCEHCGGQMRLISFITTDQPEVIDKILDHLGEQHEPPMATGPPKWRQIQMAQEHLQANPHLQDGCDDGPGYDPDVAWQHSDDDEEKA